MPSLSSVSAIPLSCEVGDINDAYGVTFTGSAVMENNIYFATSIFNHRLQMLGFGIAQDWCIENP